MSRIKIHNFTDDHGVKWAQKVSHTRVGQRRGPVVNVTQNVGKPFKVLDPSFVHVLRSAEELRNDPMYAGMTVAAYGAAGVILLCVGALIGAA